MENNPNLADILKDLYNAGAIDELALERASSYHDDLKKTANVAGQAAGDLAKHMKTILMATGIMIPVAAAATSLTTGTRSLLNKAMFNTNYDNFISKNRDLLSQFSEKDLRSYYKTLITFAPDVAKDPNAARGFILASVQYKSIGLPVTAIKDLSSINQSITGARNNIFGSASLLGQGGNIATTVNK